jgi:cytochrome c556
MKLRGYTAALLMVGCLASSAIAQSQLDPTIGERYVPRLGDIMNSVQARHIKLWLAAKALNWDLAAYELRQIKGGVVEAALLYEGIPVTNVTTMTKPVQSVADAIAAKDSRRFAKAFGELTDGCNSCHSSMQRGFITIQPPTASPFSNQSFAPPAKP